MKTITINVSEPVYREFREYASLQDRTTSELIREAMEDYRRNKIKSQKSLAQLKPSSVGTVLREYRGDDDLLGELLDDGR